MCIVLRGLLVYHVNRFLVSLEKNQSDMYLNLSMGILEIFLIEKVTMFLGQSM